MKVNDWHRVAFNDRRCPEMGSKKKKLDNGIETTNFRKKREKQCEIISFQ